MLKYEGIRPYLKYSLKSKNETKIISVNRFFSLASYDDPWLLFSNRIYIRRYDLSDDPQLSSVSAGHILTHVLDYDYAARRVYYADAGTYTIHSMGFDGENVEQINDDLHQVYGIEGMLYGMHSIQKSAII